MAPAPSGLFALGIRFTRCWRTRGRAMIQKKAGPPRTDRRLCTTVGPHRRAGHGTTGRRGRQTPYAGRCARPERTLVCWSRLRSAAASSTPARAGIAKTQALDAACVGEAGTLIGLKIPATEIRRAQEGITAAQRTLTAHGFATRPLQAHPFAALRPAPGCGPRCQRARRPIVGRVRRSCQRLFQG
jgi:hypothetical protein